MKSLVLLKKIDKNVTKFKVVIILALVVLLIVVKNVNIVMMDMNNCVKNVFLHMDL